MDTITHGLAGALIAQAGFRQRMGRVATMGLTVGAVAPDVDGLIRLVGDTATYLRYHRGLTHSFLGGGVLALLFAAVMFPWVRRIGYWRLAGLLYLGILSHLALDVITSFGTMILQPISAARFWLDWVFIIDPYLSGIIILGMVMAYVLKRHSILVGRIGLLVLGGYIALAGMNHALAVRRVAAQAAREGLAVQRLSAFPRPFSPFRWSGVVATEDATYQNAFSLLAHEPRPFVPYPRVGEHPFVRQAEEDEVVVLFRWFARYPVVKVRETAQGAVVEYFDLRFNQVPEHRPFLVRVAFDREGRMVASGFVRR